MSLHAVLADFADYLHSPAFAQLAPHPHHPAAFSRRRILTPPVLVALMLTSMSKSVQTELDTFFAHLHQQAHLLRAVSAQAFAQARAKFALTALPAACDWLIQRVQLDGGVPRWQGLRLVIADASTVCFGLRASAVRNAAAATQILFGLFLPGAELMLAASLHGTRVSERQMLFEHLDRLGPDDLLLLDRGYPCVWLVAVLISRNISFCMRVDNTGFACVRDFLRSGEPERIVTLAAPSRQQALDYECPCQPQRVRLIRNCTPNGCVRVLMTNLFDTVRFPASAFSDLYYRRWRIEEAFKRLKHRLQLEHVTGLSQQAVVHDVHAKILADNLQALAVSAACDNAQLAPDLRINRAYTHSVLKPLIPGLLLMHRAFLHLLPAALALIAKETATYRPLLSKPRRKRDKPHLHLTQKAC